MITIYPTCATITHSWLETALELFILKAKGTLINFKKWVKSIQSSGYNGACTVNG